MTGSKKDTTSSLALSNDMTSCRSTQDTILTDQELLDTVSCTNLRNQLYDFRVPVSTITTDNQEASFNAFRNRK